MKNIDPWCTGAHMSSPCGCTANYFLNIILTSLVKIHMKVKKKNTTFV